MTSVEKYKKIMRAILKEYHAEDIIELMETALDIAFLDGRAYERQKSLKTITK